MSLTHARHAGRKRTELRAIVESETSRRYAIRIDSLFLFLFLLLHYVLVRVSRLLRAALLSSSRSTERSDREAHRRSARRYKFHLSSRFFFLQRDPGIYERGCNYYVRMRDLRSRHVVCILLVARNHFMIRRAKSAGMKTSNTITGEG